MKKRIAIYGAGGFGREMKALLELEENYSFAGFFDDFKEDNRLKEDEYDDLMIAIADPAVRRNIVKNWKRKSVDFECMISSRCVLNDKIQIQKGAIICQGVQFTVDIEVGQYTIININSVIGHDAKIGDYCSIMPSVNIAGNVKIGHGVFIGSGAVILQGVTVGDNSIIGASALVNKDVPPNTTVAGVPAKQI